LPCCSSATQLLHAFCLGGGMHSSQPEPFWNVNLGWNRRFLLPLALPAFSCYHVCCYLGENQTCLLPFFYLAWRVDRPAASMTYNSCL
jgi:hypothetical protein